MALDRISSRLREKADNYRFRREASPWQMAFFDSIAFVPAEHWDTVADHGSVWFNRALLAALEQAQHDMSFRYTVFYDAQQPVAIASFQLAELDGSGVSASITDKEDGKRKSLENKLKSRVGTRLLVCGSLFASGQHGFCHTPDADPETAWQALAVGMYRLRRAEKINGDIGAVLVKDYLPPSWQHADLLTRYDYRRFQIDPNMVLELKQQWSSYEDYTAAMLSRYRNKSKTAYKKSAQLVVRELDAAAISSELPQLTTLFEAVHNKAGFAFGKLNLAAYVAIAHAIPNAFTLHGYYLDDKLVGFFSAFWDQHALDANYVGIDYDYNRDHGIYTRMLYDIVRLGIEKQVARINFGRTAGEMKSNAGAVAEAMTCYMRHRNTIANKVMKPVFQFVSPSEFEQRDPFKKL